MDSIKQDILDQLEELKQSNTIIIVEGIKDKRALEKFGITNIITLSKKPLFHIIESIAKKNKEAIILTDFDKKGKQLYGTLNSGLQKLGVKVNNKHRNFFLKKTKLSHIEGIAKYMENTNAA